MPIMYLYFHFHCILCYFLIPVYMSVPQYNPDEALDLSQAGWYWGYFGTSITVDMDLLF